MHHLIWLIKIEAHHLVTVSLGIRTHNFKILRYPFYRCYCCPSIKIIIPSSIFSRFYSSHQPVLFVFQLSGVLRLPMVLGRILVLLPLHPLHAGHVRVHVGQSAAQEHGWDQEDGQQALHDSGLHFKKCPVAFIHLIFFQIVQPNFFFHLGTQLSLLLKFGTAENILFGWNCSLIIELLEETNFFSVCPLCLSTLVK